MTVLLGVRFSRRQEQPLTYSKMFAIKQGDQMVTFAGFSCIAGDEVVTIQRDAVGLYFMCSEGRHYLQRQKQADGTCLGLTAII